MKYGLIILCSCIATILANDSWTVKHSSELKVIRNECARSLNVPDEVFTKYQNRNFSDSDPLDKSYVKCALEKLGVLGENGFYVDRVVLQFGTDPSDRSRFEKCAERTDTDITNDIWAFRAFRCFTKINSPAFYTKLDETD